MSETQPNIILIEADQLSAFVLSTYNAKGQAITPNLDAFAKQGVVFENAYCSSPLCAPSRAAMFSGSRPSENKVFGNGSIFRSDIPTMMHFMKSAGYRTVVSGKCHFIGADQLHGFDRRLTTDMYPSNMMWASDWEPPVAHAEGTSVQKLQVSGLCRTNNQILYDTEVTFRAIEYLRYEVLEPKPSPFFLHISYTQPHEAYQSVPKYMDIYNDIDIAMPEVTAEDPHPVSQWLKVHHGIDQFPPSVDTIRQSRRAYYAMVTHLDAFLGEIISELHHLGLYEDTIIAFISDHGDMLGERQMWFKRTFYEPSVKVPMIFHNPSRFAAARISQNVSLADICPTLAEIAGVKHLSDTFGSTHSASFVNLLHGTANGWKDTAIMEYFGGGVKQPWFALRQGDFKYVYCRGTAPLLYNIKNDPQETHNLIHTSEYANTIQQMHDTLFAGIDIEQLNTDIRKSKKTRTFIHQALNNSEGYVWDYTPDFDGTNRYVRGVNKPSTA